MSTVSAKPLLHSSSPATSPHWNSRSNGHSVQFYEKDSHLIEELSQFIGATILASDSALVIAKKSHRDQLFEHLSRRGLDLNLAIAYAYRDEPYKTFDWLKRASEDRDEGLLDIKVEPSFKKLHKDPRYTALLERMNLS